MRRKRVPKIFNDISKELEISTNDLVKNKTEILNNINNINEVYKGIDSSVIVLKFKKYLKDLDIIIDNYDYWSKYFLHMSDYDMDNINKTLSDIESNLDNDNNILDMTINIGDDNHE